MVNEIFCPQNDKEEMTVECVLTYLHIAMNIYCHGGKPTLKCHHFTIYCLFYISTLYGSRYLLTYVEVALIHQITKFGTSISYCAQRRRQSLEHMYALSAKYIV